MTQPEKYYGAAGGAIALECKMKAETTSDIYWFKGKVLKDIFLDRITLMCFEGVYEGISISGTIFMRLHFEMDTQKDENLSATALTRLLTYT